MKDRDSAQRSPWIHKLSPSHHLFEMAARRFDYFIVAAATWCCLDDKPARLAAVTAASLSNADTLALMLRYLESVAQSLDGKQQTRMSDLMSAIQHPFPAEQKRALRRELKMTNQGYYDALVGWYADPEAFVRRHPEIQDARGELPEWVLNELREIGGEKQTR
jgi:hypothetical protein